MPVAKRSPTGACNAMKTVEENDSLDSFFRQATGKDPLLSFSRTGDSSVQWFHLLNTLDQPDLLGWPLLTLKVPMQKCEKCSREFCSPVNYRRHIRMHRRSLNVDKESHKSRDLLAAFWDKLSVDEAKEVLSLKDAMLKEVPGSSVIRALASSLHNPGVWTLPHVYVTAGSVLLDIIQAKPARLPISSQELFSILDDASESTFLCAGTAESLQKYIFDEETAKHSLKLMNVIACTAFLLEQQLVKAWVTDKDAEALRCQKLLVEEEEAARRRLAELLERKKQRKLRQKEQKTKDRLNGREAYLNLSFDALDKSRLAEVSSPSSPSDSNLNSPEMAVNVASCLEPIQFPNIEIDEDVEAQFETSSEHIDAGNFQTAETQTANSNSPRHLATNRWQVAKSHKGGRNGFNATQDLQPIQKLTASKDRGTLSNGSKVWAKKLKLNNADEKLKPNLQVETSELTEEKTCEVMIGSIPVLLRKCCPDEMQQTSSPELVIPNKSDISEKLVKPDNIESGSGTIQAAAKPRMPEGSVLDKGHDRDGGNHCHMFSNGDAKRGGVPFCSVAVEEFFASRWEEAVLANHVKLVLSYEREPPE